MSIKVAVILGLILAVAATVAAYIFVIPDSKRRHLNKFLRWLHDVLTFKTLLIEVILRFTYVLATACCIGIGFFMLFSVTEGFRGDVSMFSYGLAILLAGPVLLRIIYEFSMLVFVLVKNVTDINKKIGAPKAAPRACRPEPQQNASNDYNPYGE